MKKCVLIGNKNHFSLENSYSTALKNLNHEVLHIDIAENIKHTSGKMGSQLMRFISVQSWIHQANRNLVLQIKDFNPDIIFVFCNAPVSIGALSFLKTILECPLILVWPDTPFNLNSHVVQHARLYDFVASYSKEALSVFDRLGFINVKWVPLAADNFMHGDYIEKPLSGSEDFEVDVSFIGGFRPERERYLQCVIDNFSQLKIEIHGPDWKKFCKNKQVLQYWKSLGLTGKNFSDALRKSRINLNIIDETNFPAANMRFFEIPISGGGVQLSTPCPEMQAVYQDKKSILYFEGQRSLIEKIHFCLDNYNEVYDIRAEAYRTTKHEHTYIHRVQDIFNQLGL